jgi:hypothetical protein
VFVEEQHIMLLISIFFVQDLCEVEWYPDMNVGGSSSVSSNVFKEKLRLREVEALRIT